MGVEVKDMMDHAGLVDEMTLVDLLGRHAANQPDVVAYRFLAQGEEDAGCLTYGQFEQRARALAAVLQSRGGAGERVLLVMDSSLDYVASFFGCLLAGAIAVPWHAPYSASAMPRFRAMQASAQARFGFTTQALLDAFEPYLAAAPDLAGIEWIVVDAVPAQAAKAWRAPRVTVDDIAFLQYTSGSTSSPRGVMVSHGNLMAEFHMVKTGFELDGGSNFVGWLPLYHDMGLIGQTLEPFYLGASCTFMDPAAFIQRPARWLRAISRYRAHTSGGPNFGYELCWRKSKPEEYTGLDLRSWTVAFNGAEPVRLETLEHFAETFAACGFRREALYPCYGLAEGTLFATGGKALAIPPYLTLKGAALERNAVELAELGEAGARTFVSCGYPHDAARVRIVNPEHGGLVEADQIGEIWLGGPSVGRGYWGLPAESAAAFGAFIEGTGEGPFFRTGDLGFQRDGHLYITGRLKDLIIIDGANHYPQDIELTIQSCHRAFRQGCGAVFGIEQDGAVQVVAVQEINEERVAEIGASGKLQAVQEAVFREHGVALRDLVLVPPRSVPKTTSGKVQRTLCRKMYERGALQRLVPGEAS